VGSLGGWHYRQWVTSSFSLLGKGRDQSLDTLSVFWAGRPPLGCTENRLRSRPDCRSSGSLWEWPIAPPSPWGIWVGGRPQRQAAPPCPRTPSCVHLSSWCSPKVMSLRGRHDGLRLNIRPSKPERIRNSFSSWILSLWQWTSNTSHLTHGSAVCPGKCWLLSVCEASVASLATGGRSEGGKRPGWLNFGKLVGRPSDCILRNLS
jgi:hypothetical protein